LRQNVNYGFTVGVRFYTAELNAAFDNYIQGISLLARAINKAPAAGLEDYRVTSEFCYRPVGKTGAKLELPD
jgi:hypothetical protein